MQPCATSSSSARPRLIFRVQSAAHPQIPWRLAIATRNQLIHGYLGVDDDVLWTIIRDDVPVLLAQLRALKADSK
jgi:uncharacterized protein with HEPN domain